MSFKDKEWRHVGWGDSVGPLSKAAQKGTPPLALLHNAKSGKHLPFPVLWFLYL